MRTVPLYGKQAKGRVALVDDEDYGLVMQYRWRLWEIERPGKRTMGPYAATSVMVKGVTYRFRMHNLILGIKGIDHADHDGLNNQRTNLRPATAAQNSANTRPQLGTSSIYKGVSWYKKRRVWRAYVKVAGRATCLGEFVAELEAAYAYDAAAREAFGEYACTNFADEPTEVMREGWRSAQESRTEAVAEIWRERGRTVGRLARQPVTRICTVRGSEYRSKATRSIYCGRVCRNKAWGPYRAEKRRERLARDGRPVGPKACVCTECGNEFQARISTALYCGIRCNQRAFRRRKKEAELEGRLF